MARFILAALTAIVLTITPAVAGECYSYKKVTTYKTVVCYEARQQAYTKCVVEYDHCGRPYKVHKTFYRTVQVPVKKQVPVVSWVKVYH
jgi:hypothetical protein